MIDSTEQKPSVCFSTTQWTQVIYAAQDGRSEVVKKALEAFCLQYREAIYSFVRRQGHDHEEAEDLVHDFVYVKILKDWDEKDTFVHKARRETGMFRSFLSNTIHWFLNDVRDRKFRKKRGGGAIHESIEALTAAGMDVSKTVEQEAGSDFDTRFGLNLLDRACASLRECEQNLELLMGSKTQAKVAEELRMSLGAVKKMHFDFREKLKGAIRAEVRRTGCRSEGDVKEEIRYLMSLFGK